MTDAFRKTYPVSIPSIALAMKAWNLAFYRVWGGPGHSFGPERRAAVNGSATSEYYEIIDRLSRGERP